jgi:ribosome-binding factor A
MFADITLAKIYISSYKSVQYVARAVEALNHASGFIRVALGQMLTSRNTPKPVFFVDNGMREGFMINERIKMIVSDRDDKSGE